jgi:hypothetical protein
MIPEKNETTEYVPRSGEKNPSFLEAVGLFQMYSSSNESSPFTSNLISSSSSGGRFSANSNQGLAFGTGGSNISEEKQTGVLMHGDGAKKGKTREDGSLFTIQEASEDTNSLKSTRTLQQQFKENMTSIHCIPDKASDLPQKVPQKSRLSIILGAKDSAEISDEESPNLFLVMQKMKATKEWMAPKLMDHRKKKEKKRTRAK